LEIQALCQKRGWRFILDAAHALGVPGIEQGADAIAFSFYATKVLSCGEGGAAAFPSAANAQFAECWANQGKIPEDLYSPKVVGTNARLSELAGILLDVQLLELSRILEARRTHIEWYRHQFGVPLWPTDSVAYNGYKCVVQTQNQVLGPAAAQVLDTPIYRVPLHLMEPLVSSDRVHVVAPNSSLLCAEMWCQRHVALPCHPGLTEEHRQQVVQFLRPLLGL
jgi:dTDP-4-amino-4,6-dideoxygalactose transaminase